MSRTLSYDLLYEIGKKYLLQTLRNDGSGFDCCKFMLINASCQHVVLSIFKQNLDLQYLDFDNACVESTTKKGVRMDDHQMGFCLKQAAPMRLEMEELGIFRFYLTETFYYQALVNGGWPLEFIHRLRSSNHREKTSFMSGDKEFLWEESRMESFVRLTLPFGVDLANPNLVDLEEYFQSYLSQRKSPLQQCLQIPAHWDLLSRMLNLNSITVFVSISDQCGREFQQMPEPNARLYAPRTKQIAVLCASPSRILEVGRCYDVELWQGGGHLKTLFFYFMHSCPNLDLLTVKIHHVFLPTNPSQLAQFSGEVFAVIECLMESYLPVMKVEEVLLHLEFPITICIALKPLFDEIIKNFSYQHGFQFIGRTYTMRHNQNHLFVVQWNIDFL